MQKAEKTPAASGCAETLSKDYGKVQKARLYYLYGQLRLFLLINNHAYCENTTRSYKLLMFRPRVSFGNRQPEKNIFCFSEIQNPYAEKHPRCFSCTRSFFQYHSAGITPPLQERTRSFQGGGSPLYGGSFITLSGGIFARRPGGRPHLHN